MKILRKEAIELVAYKALFSLTNEERENILIDLYSEDDQYLKIKDYSLPKFNDEIINYLKGELKGVISSYLENQVNLLFDCSITVIGKEQEFFQCPCCKYRTIEVQFEYMICKVCYWEDDGIRDGNIYSSPNNMTLNEAKSKYKSIGAISSKFLDYVDVEGKFKFGI